MGHQANVGRNTSLDQKKTRAAGRADRTGQHATGREAVGDATAIGGAGGRTRGAFGKGGGNVVWLDRKNKVMNRRPS